MAGGAYSALSGLQTRLAQLDRIAADIANAGTAGYKTERVPTVEARRPDFGEVLQGRSRPPAATSTSPSTAAASSRSRRPKVSATPATASSRAGPTARW
jgi:flagellar basal body rod protein FlgG